MYEGINYNTYLIITSLPAFDNARPLHAFIRFQIRSLIKEKMDLLSLPIIEGNPKYFPVPITCRTPIMRDKSSCDAPLILWLKNTSDFRCCLISFKNSEQMLCFHHIGPAKQETVVCKQQMGHHWCATTYLYPMNITSTNCLMY